MTTLTMLIAWSGLEPGQLLTLGSTLLDVLIAGAIAWLLVRSRRDQDATLAEQRAALERLKGDLAELLEQAERRARSLEDTVARVADPRQDRPPASAPAARSLARPAPSAGGERRLGIDPAEARLVRDLEVSFSRSRRA